MKFMAMIRLPVAVRMALLLVGTLTLSACVSTEPLPAPQHVNLSPERVELKPVADADQAVDFGIDAAVNESDSLANLEALPGVRVRAVRPQSAAQAAGLEAGDVILSIDGTETNHPDVLATIADAAASEAQFTFEVRRDTTVFETEVAAPRRMARDGPEARYRVDPVMTRAGYRTELVEGRGSDAPRTSVARITKLFPESPLPGTDLDVGDAVFAVDDQPVQSAQDLVNRLNAHDFGDRVTLGVLPATNGAFGAPEQVEVALWDPGRRISEASLRPLFHYEHQLDPPLTKLSVLDFWLFSVYAFERRNGEREHSLLSLFRFTTGYGELIDETDETGGR